MAQESIVVGAFRCQTGVWVVGQPLPFLPPQPLYNIDQVLDPEDQPQEIPQILDQQGLPAHQVNQDLDPEHLQPPHPVNQVLDPVPHVPGQNPQHNADRVAVWDEQRVFVTFEDKNVTLTGGEMLTFFNRNYKDSVQSISFGRDAKGFRYATLLMEEKHTAAEVLGQLPSIEINIGGRWVRCRRFFSRYPPY